MKNFSAIAILAIALVSCKKETKTITKVDPETGKTVTVEIPADSSSAAPAASVGPVTAIYDSAGVYQQKFRLEKGKSYPLKTLQKDVQTMTAPNGESQSGTNESVDEMSFLVNNFENGVYDITINLLGKRNSQTANGQTIAVDTKAVEPKDEQLKMMWKVNKALVGNKLNLKMDENGKVISITGFDPIYAKVSASMNGIIKDAKQKTAFTNSFKESFNEKMLKEQFTKNLVLFPAKGAKIGQKWEETENATPELKMTTTYTLKNVANGVAEIGVSGGIPKKSDKMTKEGVTRTVSSELSQNGTIILDQNTGWIKNQKINLKTSQSQTMSDGKQSQTLKSSTVSTVSVNP